MSFQIEPKILKIITSEEDGEKEREQDIITLLESRDYVPEEERGVEFLGLKGNCYTFKVDGIMQAYDILYLFRENYVDEDDLVETMGYDGETLTVTTMR